MSDLFISYSNNDKARAEVFARVFEQAGWSVFWDKQIPPGKAFDQYIEEQLDAAKCIVVLWSQTSTKSDWVKEEAQRGVTRKNLVPVLIDRISPPLGFGRIEAAQLADWEGDPDNSEFQNMLRAITLLIHPDGVNKAAVKPERQDKVSDDKGARSTIPNARDASWIRRHGWRVGFVGLSMLAVAGLIGAGLHSGWFGGGAFQSSSGSGESKTDGWGVVFGSDTSIDAAKDEIKRASGKGIPGPRIYFRNNYYASIALADDSKTAQQYLEIVKDFRPDAYIARMDAWCINPKPDDGFTRCQGK
jgi:hypothetical protein